MSEEDKLRQAVANASTGNILAGSDAWASGSNALTTVAVILEGAAPSIKNGLGLEAGDAAEAAFKKAAMSASKRSTTMNDGYQALQDAQGALADAENVLKDLGPTPTAPTRRTDVDANSVDGIEAEKTYQSEQRSYAYAMADREAKARAANEALATQYKTSTDVMRKIHGEAPTEPTSQPTGSTPGSNGSNGSTRASHSQTAGTPHLIGTTPTSHPNTHPQSQTQSTDSGSSSSTPTTTTPAGDYQSVHTTAETNSSGGLLSNVGAGAVGAGALAGSAAFFGGRTPSLPSLFGGGSQSSVSATGARPIGTSTAAVRGTSSTLGRGGASTGSQPGARGAGSGAGRGTGSAGRSSAGSRNGSSSRTGAGTRGRGRDKDERDEQGFMSTEDEWTDDEGTAESVLD